MEDSNEQRTAHLLGADMRGAKGVALHVVKLATKGI
jgi:hypothetical protein